MDNMIRSGHPASCGCHLCGLYGERARAIRAEQKLWEDEIKISFKRRELHIRVERLTAHILGEAKRPEPV